MIENFCGDGGVELSQCFVPVSSSAAAKAGVFTLGTPRAL